MVARKFSFIAFLLVVSCATANEQSLVKLNNQLSACISVSDMQILTDSRIPTLSFNVKIKKSIAKCGCKSALGAYSVFSQMTEYQSYIIGGKISFAKSEHKYLPLSAEQSLINKKKLEVIFSCSRPD